MSVQGHKLFKKMNLRRHALRISLRAISSRSGVSIATVQRILSGDLENASFGNIRAILKALGLTVVCLSEIEAPQLREAQARKKAAKLVGMVQGTSGLEAQAVDDADVQQMFEQTVHELLAGSPRKLWAE